MCYSAMVKQRLKSLGLSYEARVDYDRFETFFDLRSKGEKITVSSVMESDFEDPKTPAEKRIKKSIDAYKETCIRDFEKELFVLKKRLADAERKLASKPTKAAEKDKGIAERKIEKILGKLE